MTPVALFHPNGVTSRPRPRRSSGDLPPGIPSVLEMMGSQGIPAAVLPMAFWSGLFADADDVAAARRLARSPNEGAAEAIRSHRTASAALPALPCPMRTAPFPAADCQTTSPTRRQHTPRQHTPRPAGLDAGGGVYRSLPA